MEFGVHGLLQQTKSISSSELRQCLRFNFMLQFVA